MVVHQSRTRARSNGTARKALLEPVQGPAYAVDGVVQVADLSIDPVWHEVLRRGERVHVTPLEFHLLYLLAQNANRVVPYASLIERAWGYEAENNTAEAILKTPISRLRSKVGLHAPGPLTLRSVAHVGYMLRATAALGLANGPV